VARRKTSKESRSKVSIGSISGSIDRSIIVGRDVVINLTWVWKLIIGALLLAGILYAALTYGPSLYHWYKYRATDDEILILLANFKDQSENVTYDAAGSIEEALRTALIQYDLPNVRLVRINQTFTRNENEAVKRLGERYNATIFIWGHYDDAGMYPRFQVLQEKRLDVLPEKPADKSVNLANPPDDFAMYVNRELPAQMKYLAQFTVGQVLYFKRSFPEALILFERAIKSSQELEETEKFQRSLTLVYFYEGFIHLNEEEYVQSVQDYTQAIQLDPSFALAYNNRGNAHYSSGNYFQAIDDFTQAIELEPDSPLALYNRAITLDTYFFDPFYSRALAYGRPGTLAPGMYNVNAFVQILNDLNRAVTLDPEFTLALYRRGLIHSLLANDQFSAIQDFDRVIELNPDFTLAYYSRGVANVESGRLTLAIDDYNRCIELDPNYARAYYNRGIAYAKSDNLTQAISDFTKAIELQDVECLACAYYNRGYAYRDSGNLVQAIRDLEEYLKLAPADAPDREAVFREIEQLTGSK
jgi:tetratricopeptide (TPR) repeat protein